MKILALIASAALTIGSLAPAQMQVQGSPSGGITGLAGWNAASNKFILVAVDSNGIVQTSGSSSSSSGNLASSYQGAYSPSATYAAGNIVINNGSSYLALQPSNSSNPQTPGVGTSYWGLIAAVGAQGLQGLQGQGFNLRGAWAPSTAYAAYDVVTYNGATYVAPSSFTSGASFAGSNWTVLLTYASAPVVPPSSNVQLNSATCTLIGDSLSASGQDASGVTLASALQAISPQCSTVVNRGVSGQTSTQIAVRVGAVSTTATIAGGTIPACTTAGACTSVGVSFPSGYEPVTAGSSYSNAGQPTVAATISGVAGIISWSGSSTVFTRTAAGAAVSSAANVPLSVSVGNVLGGFNIIWAGRNNYQSQSQVLSDVAAIVAALPSPKRYLVVSVINGDNSTEWTVNGTPGAGATALANLNAALAAAYPNNFVDVLTPLKAAYNSALPQDVIDNGHGIIPNSMRAFRQGATSGFALTSAIADTSSCSFSVTTGAMQPGFTMLVDQERIYVSASDGTNVSGCTRGYAGTTAATHTSGTPYAYWDGIHVGGPQADTLIAALESAWIASNDPGPGNATAVLAQNVPARLATPPALGAAQAPVIYGSSLTAGAGSANAPLYVINPSLPYQLYGGSGYTSVPIVTFSNGATGTAVLTGGVVSSITMTAYGVPTATYPTITFSGGSPAIPALAVANASQPAFLSLSDGYIANSKTLYFVGGSTCYRNSSNGGGGCLGVNSAASSYITLLSGNGIVPATTGTGLLGHPAYWWQSIYGNSVSAKSLVLTDATNTANTCTVTLVGGTTRPTFGCSPSPTTDTSYDLGAASLRWRTVYVGTGGLVSTLTTPASSAAACTAGQITADATYIYVCTAANTYKRVALSTF